jgi:hypothetical protein
LTELVTEAWRLSAPKRMLAAYDAEHPVTERAIPLFKTRNVAGTAASE